MTPLPPSTWTPVLIVPLILFAIYRRFRRNFGRQPMRPGRMKTRIAVLAVVGVLILFPALLSPRLAAGAVVGLLGGAALAIAGLRLTRFETDSEGRRWYTPHGYIGIAISLVLLGRLIYRFLVIYPALHASAGPGRGAFPLAGYQRSPLTLALLAAVIAYYVVYLIGVLRAPNWSRTQPTIPP